MSTTPVAAPATTPAAAPTSTQHHPTYVGFVHPNLYNICIGATMWGNTLLNALAPLASFDLTINDVARGLRMSPKQLTKAVALPASELARDTLRCIGTWLTHDPTALITTIEPWRYGRRLQALRAAGVDYATLTRETTLDREAIDTLIAYACRHAKRLGSRIQVPNDTAFDRDNDSHNDNGNNAPDWLTRQHARLIVRCYAAHCADPVDTPHPQVPAYATGAARKSWPLPFCWNDIDDAAEQPGVTHCFMCEDPSTERSGMCLRCYSQWSGRKRRTRLRAVKASDTATATSDALDTTNLAPDDAAFCEHAG